MFADPDAAGSCVCTLAPGLSTQLPDPSSQTPAPAVAQVLADGSITLEFGQVPCARTIDFADVLRLESKASKPVSVTADALRICGA